MTCCRVDEAVAGATSPLSPTSAIESEEETITPVYMNVSNNSCHHFPAQPPPIAETDDKHCYMNLIPGAVALGPPPAVIRQMSLPIAPPAPEPQRAVNYIVLDLNGGSPPPPPSPTPRPTTEGYATIDFDKTVALSHSVNPNCFDNEGSRKTRHNSATPRQSASLSD